jgi:hypothetical protein
MHKKTKGQPRPPGKCIFCNNPGDLTKEHIFPDWLKNVIPRKGIGSVHFVKNRRLDPITRAYLAVNRKLEDNAEMTNTKKRNVCFKCNNGWMKLIQDNVIPYLSEMILGRNITLNVDEINEVVKWIVMTSITAEFTQSDSVFISSPDRLLLKEQGVPGKHWYIFIGKYNGNDEKTVYRHSNLLPLDGSEDLTKVVVKDNPRNCQCTTIILDQLFIVSATLPVKEILGQFMKSISFFNEHLFLLSPRLTKHSDHLSWPPTKGLGDFDVLQISNILPQIGNALA